MDRSACQCGTAIPCAALRRNIRPGYCVFKKHFSKRSPPNSNGENGEAGVRSQVPGLRRRAAETAFSVHRLRCPTDHAASLLDRTGIYTREKMKRWSLQLIVVLAPVLCSFAQTTPAADLIIQNAHVWTVDPSRPEAEAVAIVGERIA